MVKVEELKMKYPGAAAWQMGDSPELANALADLIKKGLKTTLYTILCKCLFSEVTVQAVTELDNKAAHCHTPVPQRHRPFL